MEKPRAPVYDIMCFLMPAYIMFAVEVPIEEVAEQDFEGHGQERIHALANHFGIFRDLFGDAFFYPKMKLKVGYTVKEEEDMVNPVFHGNKLLPEEVCSLIYIAQCTWH